MKGSRAYVNILRDVLSESLSEDHVAVVEKLKKPMYDEDVASELRIKATIVRTLLNDLHAHNLVEYERSKNKKTGWYTYKWKRREDNINDYVRGYLDKKLVDLKKKLEYERQGITFNCSCNRVPFDKALENKFVCPDCSVKYAEFDNSEVVDKIVSEISRINSLLEQT